MATLSIPANVRPTRHAGDARSARIEVEFTDQGARRLVSDVALAVDDFVSTASDGLWLFRAVDWVDPENLVWEFVFDPWAAQSAGALVPGLNGLSDNSRLDLNATVQVAGEEQPRYQIGAAGWVAPWKLAITAAEQVVGSQTRGAAFRQAMHDWLAARYGGDELLWPPWTASRLDWADGVGDKIRNPWATPSLDQSNSSSGTSQSLTSGGGTGGAPSSGNLVVCVAHARDNPSAIAWDTSQVSAVENFGDPVTCIGWVAGDGSTTSFGWTWTGSAGVAGAGAYDFAGMTTSSPVDQSNSNDNTTGSSHSSGSVTTTHANVALVAGFSFDGAPGTVTLTNSTTPLTGAAIHDSGMWIVSSTGTYSETASITGSAASAAAIAAFKDDGAGGAAFTPRVIVY